MKEEGEEEDEEENEGEGEKKKKEEERREEGRGEAGELGDGEESGGEERGNEHGRGVESEIRGGGVDAKKGEGEEGGDGGERGGRVKKRIEVIKQKELKKKPEGTAKMKQKAGQNDNRSENHAILEENPQKELKKKPSNFLNIDLNQEETEREVVGGSGEEGAVVASGLVVGRKDSRFSRVKTNLKVSFQIDQNPPPSFSRNPFGFSTTSKLTESTHLASEEALKTRIYTIVSQFYLVTKFIRVLRNSTIYKSPKYLKKENFSLMNDSSFYLEGWMRNFNIYAKDHLTQLNVFFLLFKWISNNLKMIKFVRKLLKPVNVVFDPINPLRIVWDCLQMGLLIFFFTLIPVQISFEVDLVEELGSFRKVSFYLLLADFFVNLNTAYYEKGELMTSRQRIVRNYLRQNFLRNLISFIYFSPFFALPKAVEFFKGIGLLSPFILDAIPLLFYLKLFTLRRILTRIKEYLFIEEKVYNRLSLLKLIIAIFFFSHLFACIWHYIGCLRKDNWMTALDITTLSWPYRYLYSYYYVVVVMNTVGFGDIVPKNDLERIVAILFIYVACGMFAYTINSIGVIVQDLNKKNKDFNRSVSLVNGYMKQKKIHFDLRIRVQKYLEYIWLEKSGQNEEETHNIINKLSKSLKEELLLSANGVIFKDLPLFYMNFSEETLRRVVYKIKEVSLVPGDMLFVRDETGEDMTLYIVKKGEVEMMGEGMHVIKKVGEGAVCGEVSFFSGKKKK